MVRCVEEGNFRVPEVGYAAMICSSVQGLMCMQRATKLARFHLAV